MRDLLDNYTAVNEVRPVWTWRHNLQTGGVNATPLMAAVLLAPERVPTLIEKGANANGVHGQSISPLQCAANPNFCGEKFVVSAVGKRDDFSIMKALLEKGANPNRADVDHRRMVPSLICLPGSPPLTENSINKLKILSEYGAKTGNRELEACDRIARIVGISDKKEMLIEDIRRHGMKEALNLWSNPDEYFEIAIAREKEEEERREIEAAERQRQQEIAQEKLNAKKKAISSYIASRPDLSQAMEEVVQIGAEKKAIDSFIRKNGFGRLCETGRNNTFYQSKTCLSEWEVVRGQARSHKSSLDAAYKKQRDWFAGLFGQNAGVAAAVVDDRVASTPSDKNVKQQYAPIEQQLIRITESEARAERAESRRREQQQMADFMNHIQTTFDRTNRMLDRNMAQTHRVVNQAYASQRVRDVNSSSGYRERSAPAMRDLNKELEEIDRSFDVSASSGSGGMKSGGVATAGAGSSGKSAYRVCGGPTTVPAMNQVFDVRGLNSGKASPDYQCPAGGKPVVAGAYNLETGNISWLNRPPTYKQEPVRGENGRPNGARVSWDAYRYECLCSNSGSGSRAGGYQQ
ncbi:hypothetical protein [Alcanivorax sp.]|uniref:hypothetical protein n=1 Tax=Alcanivorax sp. TaxID=1872427 RepID=UPI003A9339E1